MLRAAGEEFRRRGFVGATTASIARNADVTEAQLFRYFESKAELFREAVFEPLSRHFAEFNARHPTDAADAESIRDHARLYIAELQQFLDEHSKLLLALVVAERFESGRLKVGEIDSLRHYFEGGAAAMSRRVGKHAKVDPKLLVRVSFAAVLGCVIFKDWLFPAGLAGHEQIDSAVIDFVIDGIGVDNSGPGPRRSLARSSAKV